MTLSAAGRRRKGATWAAKVAAWLDSYEERYVRDHTGVSEADFALDMVCLEAKNQKDLSLGAALDQARRDAGMDRFGAVLHHRRGHAHVGDAFVTMRADDWLELYRVAAATGWLKAER